ncbi:MAG: hypothetical protein KME23_01175 [Goleter apudmare HA4340-LM2]|jgi:hypothetical protein|nr:hypothetical protein [Goleter apudmare HA4340-LM2]
MSVFIFAASKGFYKAEFMIDAKYFSNILYIFNTVHTSSARCFNQPIILDCTYTFTLSEFWAWFPSQALFYIIYTDIGGMGREKTK